MSHTGSLDPLFFAISALVTFLGISTLLLVNHTGSPSVWWVPHAYPLFSVPSPLFLFLALALVPSPFFLLLLALAEPY